MSDDSTIAYIGGGGATYPSVVMVTIVYQNASGMLVKSVSGSFFST